ncbi:MAG: TetR family transcriptional regulator, partial [Azorhizobium sp. 12-66-6]
GLDLLRAVMARGQARGEVRSDVALRFPQMMFASAVTALVWQNLFSAIDPLDVRAFVAAHTQALLRGLEGDGP